MLDSRRVFGAALLLLPTGLMVYFAFNAGGFYSGPPAYVGMLLAVLLVLRVIASADPFAGFGVAGIVAVGALAAFALLTLLSEHWSHIPGAAVVDFDRVLVYLLLLVLFASSPRSRLRLAWILRALAVGIFTVCLAGLISRVLPAVWPTSPDIANNRLSFPVTYWNVLGLLAVFGLVLCVHLTSDEREPRLVRIAAAGATPALATTLYFTFSRGSIAVGLIGLIVYAAVGRPRSLLAGLLAVVPTVSVAVAVAYGADRLASPDPTTAAAVRQGHGVALAVGACMLGALALRAAFVFLVDPRLVRFSLPARQTRIILRASAGVAIVVILAAATAFSGTISREYHRFLRPAPPGQAADLRTRLADPGNNGRLEMWRIAWHQFEAKPVLGQGTGTFVNAFATHRTTTDFVVNAHSLYLETLDELGLIGGVLLLTVVLLILVVSAARARGPNRALHAAVFSLLLVWALESGIDWDWQMPVVTLVFFSLAGTMLATPHDAVGRSPGEPEDVPRHQLSPSLRTAAGVACALLAVAPAYVWLSQRQLDRANAAFARGDWRNATDAALGSISILGIRAEPYEIVAYADVHRDLPGLAIKAMQKAESLDPDNWNYAYGLALMRAAAGLNPLRAARRALQLNPREQLVQVEWQTLSGDQPTQWETDAKTIADAFTTL